MVLFSGFLRELRADLPNTWISMVVKPSVRNLFEATPYVNEVLVYDGGSSFAWGPLQRLYRAARLARTHLWPKRFDLAIVPRWGVDDYGASQLAYVSGARRRIAYSERVSPYKSRANSGYDRLFTAIMVDRQPRHEVQRNFGLLRFLGGEVRSEKLELSVLPDDDQFAQELLTSRGLLPGQKLVVLGVGARHARKMWPLENFGIIAAWLSATYGAKVIVVGDDVDARLADELSLALPGIVINAAGRTTLRQAVALMRRASLFVGNDSGPKHLAAATGVPVVEVSWHSRSASGEAMETLRAFAAWQVENRIVQPDASLEPCTGSCDATVAHCITNVSVDSVKRAIAGLLGVAPERES